MYALVFILSTPAFLGNYTSMNSCQNAIRAIYSARMNPPGQTLPEVEKSITSIMQNKKEYICIPVTKD